MKRALVTTSALAVEINLGTSTVRQYAREGRIPVAWTTPGGHHRYDPDAVTEALRRAATVSPEGEATFSMPSVAVNEEFPTFALTPGDVTIAPGQPSRRQSFSILDEGRSEEHTS